MISHFSGTVTAAGPTWVVLDNHGIGVKVLCPPATAASARVDQTMTLQTSLVVREDSLTLYGFVEADDRDAFELVQTASGVGPKLAAAIMSVLDWAQGRSEDDPRAQGQDGNRRSCRVNPCRYEPAGGTVERAGC